MAAADATGDATRNAMGDATGLGDAEQPPEPGLATNPGTTPGEVLSGGPAADPVDPAGLRLVRPTAAHLPGYVAALRRGWSANTHRGATAAAEALTRIDADAEAVLALMDDPQGAGPPVTLPDGSVMPRLPSLSRWLWLGADAAPEGFSGNISLRWTHSGAPLPTYVLGHIGYAVVPWRQGHGLATRALALLLPLARAQGLVSVDITTDLDNLASQRVIVSNGGVLVEHFDKGPAYGHASGLRYRIALR